MKRSARGSKLSDTAKKYIKPRLDKLFKAPAKRAQLGYIQGYRQAIIDVREALGVK